jgi:hypothetical protein
MARIKQVFLASISGVGAIGWMVWLLILFMRLLSVLGDIDLLHNYLGSVGSFLETGWGTLISIVVGAIIVGSAIHHGIRNPKPNHSAGSPKPQRFFASLKSRVLSINPSQMIIGGFMVIVFGVVIGGAMIGFGLWQQGKALTSQPKQAAATPGVAPSTQVPALPPAVSNSPSPTPAPTNSDILWSFETDPDANFLGWGGPGASTLVYNFQAQETNNTDDPFRELRGFVRIDAVNSGQANREFPASFTSAHTGKELTNGVPRRSSFFLSAKFDGGILFDKFLNEYTPFTFVFFYDGKTYRRHFSKDECVKIIAVAVFPEAKLPWKK